MQTEVLAMSRPEDQNHHQALHSSKQHKEAAYHGSPILDDKPASSTSSSLATAAAAAAAAAAASNTTQNPLVSQSVVPDLMSVYESMTLSSTPSNPLYQQEHYGQPQERSSIHYSESAPPHSQWISESISVPIPPPFPYPSQPPQESGRTNARRSSSNSSHSSSGRSLRKRSKHEAQEPQDQSESSTRSKTRRKSDRSKDKNDGRWSKRFTWPDDLHRDFVSAIFDVGLKHSSPSTILEQMAPHEQVTTERIKSHLQKYRLHRQKSKKEFMSSYDAKLRQFNAEGIDSVTSLAGGEVAAHLTYSTLTQPDPDANASGEPQNGANAAETPKSKPKKIKPQETQEMIVIPRLTEAEKLSPIGSSLGYMLGLFFSLKQQLEAQRQLQRQQKEEEEAAKVSLEQAKSEQSQQHSAYGTYAAGAAAAAASPKKGLPIVQSTRTNLEENSMMKREMRNQMAFQNKMRALKQQEVQKYNKMAGDPRGKMEHSMQTEHADGQGNTPMDEQHQHLSNVPVDAQGVGEADNQGTGEHSEHAPMGMGEDDDFWNAGVVDEALFDFLLNS